MRLFVEERDELRRRVAELEAALQPFAEIMLNECENTNLMDDASLLIPVPVIRRAARAHAGIDPVQESEGQAATS